MSIILTRAVKMTLGSQKSHPSGYNTFQINDSNKIMIWIKANEIEI